MPEGESVSMTAVPEAKTLKVVFAAMPWPSLPSHSPASDCSFLKATAECVPAHSGAAMDAASNRSSESLRGVTDASGKKTAQDVASTGQGAPRFKGLDAGSAGREARVETADSPRAKYSWFDGAVKPIWPGSLPVRALCLRRRFAIDERGRVQSSGE